MITRPQYLIIVIILVGGLVGIMYIMKNVFHIQAYPVGHTSHPDNKVKAPLKPNDEPLEVNEDTIMFEAEADIVSNESSDPGEVETNFDNPEKYFEDLLEEYKNALPGKLDGKPNRTDIVVRYYPRDVDYDKVKALKDLRLYIHKRQAGEELLSYQSNSLFYGDEVPTKDIQLIAYTLIQNGVPLKQIIPSRYHNDWKSRAVEIGADTALTTDLVLSLEEVKGFTNRFNQNEW